MKKIIFALTVALATSVFAVEPSCVVDYEFWGKKYFILTDVNGIQYKINPPNGNRQIRVNTKTGWYLLDANGVIVDYSDNGVK